MKSRKIPVAVDLFAGAGGLGEGLQSAGFDVVAAVELHPQAALTYAFNHPNSSVFFGDIRSLSSQLLLEAVIRRTGNEAVDLVVGGPPCQGFSTAGKMNSQDPRNSLFHQFVRVVRELRPKAFLLENVPGFKNAYNGEAFNEASRLLGNIGYELADDILDASDFGLPQRRERFVMVGWLSGQVGQFEFPPPTHCPPTLLPTGIEHFITVEEAIGDLAFLEPGWEAHRYQARANGQYQRDRRNGCELLFNHLATRHRSQAIEMFQHIPEGGTISSVPDDIRSAKKTMARLHRDRISNAVLALPDDLIHYCHDRIPTVRELARLQSFDDDYVFWGKRTSGFMERRVDVPQYTQVGNAVPPLLGRSLGIALLEAMNAVVMDRRNLEVRRRRHQWVQGSSGYTGYSLSPAAVGKIDLHDVLGYECSLPVGTGDAPVTTKSSQIEWKTSLRPSARSQWVPTVNGMLPHSPVSV
jgi:DNA (cytosine-5)-methyltransferase 1